MGTLDTTTKEQMAARALTLRDRLDTPRESTRADTTRMSDEWIDEWRQQVSDDSTAFFRRLDIADISIGECRRRIERDEWPEGEPLPNWVERIEDVVSYARANALERIQFDTDDENTVPFFHVVTVFVEYASDELSDTLTAPLSEPAIEAAEHWLLERLQSLFAHSLFIEFKTFLATRDRDLALSDDPSIPTSPHRYYTEFVADFFDEGLTTFVAEYAVLSKLLVTIIDQWVETTAEFASRLAADRPLLRELFNSGEKLGQIEVVTFHGDRHGGGRRVAEVTFESGTKVAYKPRNIEAEDAFYGFLSWVNENTELPAVRPLRCLCRDEYGWMEWVESVPCDSADDVSTYYRRAGVLLCLLYALNFTDGHLENVIAAGAHPVLIDLETLAQPDLPVERRPTDGNVSEIIRNSVLRTGFLPMTLPESDLEDTGGLGEERAKQTNAQIPEFEQVNTDAMDLQYRETGTIEGNSLPYVDGDRKRPAAYRDDIAEGFAAAYRFVLENRDDLLATDGPLRRFENVTYRYLYRATYSYRSRLVHLSTPSNLRTGLGFGCKAEALAKPFAVGSLDKDMWAVYEAERTAMWRLDVPRFTIESDSTHLFHDEAIAARNVFASSPMAQIRDRIERFTEADLREQLDYLHMAYRPESLYYPDAEVASIKETETNIDVEAVASKHPSDLLDRIHENASLTQNDELTWYLREKFEGGGFHLHQIAKNLYNGRFGVALLCGALTAVSGDKIYRDFADEVVAPITTELDESNPLPNMEIGGGTGVGSLIYGFSKLDEFLETDRYMPYARECASLLDRERIESDGQLDVLRGSAGAILGLLALYHRTGDEAVLNKAVNAGEHLLSSRVERDGYRAWRTTTHDRFLTGFSHGISGIAYALTKLGEASGEHRFRDAAVESLQFEREQFVSERGNWPNLHPDSRGSFDSSWCAGRAGGGLARLGMYECDGRDELERKVRHAIRADDPAISGSDHLCCGNFGRVAFLLRAGRTLNEPRYVDRARRLAGVAIERAERNGRFAVAWQTARWHNPSFFLGESGIGYVLLRLAHPELPSVVLWE